MKRLLFGLASLLLSWSAFAETIPSTLSAGPVPAWYSDYNSTTGAHYLGPTCAGVASFFFNRMVAGGSPWSSCTCVNNDTQVSCHDSRGWDVGPYAASRACPPGSTGSTDAQCLPTCVGVRSCPDGEGYNISADRMTCSRPDCRSDQVRGEGGTCRCQEGKVDQGGVCKQVCPQGTHAGGIDYAQCLNDCIGDQTEQADGSCRCKSGNTVGTSFQYGTDGSAGNCANGCSYKPGAGSWCPGGVAAALGLKDAASVTCYGTATSTGDICGANAPNRPNIPVTPRPPVTPDTSGTGSDGSTPDPKNTPDNSKSPEACGAAGGTYYTSNGVGKCGTATPDNSMDKYTTDKKSTTTTNPDGSTTETTETTKTTTGSDGKQVTEKSTSSVTRDSNGNVIGTGGSNSTGTGTGKSDSGQVGDCTLEPTAPHCKTGTVKPKGKFEPLDPKVEEAKKAFSDKFDAVKAQAKAAVGTFTASGGGRLPCPAPIQVLGQPFTICAAKYETQLSVIGLIVMFMAAVASVFIVFKRG